MRIRRDVGGWHRPMRGRGRAVGCRLDAVIVVVGTLSDQLAPGQVGMTNVGYRAACGSPGESGTPPGVVALRSAGANPSWHGYGQWTHSCGPGSRVALTRLHRIVDVRLLPGL